MKNQFQNGDAIDVVAPSGGTVSGNGYLIGSMFGIAANTVAAGVEVALWLKGVYSVNKNSAEAWTVGELIYWDNSAHDFTVTSTSNKLVGVAVAAAANPSSIGIVRLNGAFIS